MIKEIWKPVIGYEDSYKISNLGTLKSIDRWLNSGFGSKRFCKGQIVKPRLDKDGYLRTCTSKNQKSKEWLLHRLIAIHFIPNPENKTQINHKDGVKLNNSLDNLEWCTHLENQRHAKDFGLRDNATRKGEKSNFSKLKDSEILYIRKNYDKKTLNQKQLGKMFNVSNSTISMVLRRIIWKHI